MDFHSCLSVIQFVKVKYQSQIAHCFLFWTDNYFQTLSSLWCSSFLNEDTSLKPRWSVFIFCSNKYTVTYPTHKIPQYLFHFMHAYEVSSHLRGWTQSDVEISSVDAEPALGFWGPQAQIQADRPLLRLLTGREGWGYGGTPIVLYARYACYGRAVSDAEGTLGWGNIDTLPFTSIECV